MSCREELIQLAQSNPEQIADRVMDLEHKLEELQRRLKKNSRNSSKPPSSDGLNKPKPKSLRGKSKRKVGGQPKHPGKNLKPVEKPNHVQKHLLSCCPHCSEDLSQQAVISSQKRQVFDLPPISLEVTEHQAQIKECPGCAQKVVAPFPAGVDAPAQYGPGIAGLMVYFNQQQLLPLERLSQVSEDLFGHRISAASIVSFNQRCHANLENFEVTIKEQLRQAEVVHCDESGLRVENKLHWIHSTSTKYQTFYGIHPKRGKEAMDAFDILPQCENWLIHDFWAPYFQYDTAHALCNEHLLRELKFLEEENQQSWAKELATFLCDLNKRRLEIPGLSELELDQAHQSYNQILQQARQLHPKPIAVKKSRGRRKQSKEQNLLDRLEDYDHCVLAFMYDPLIPFTNNLAEQDIRMIKVKQKISGCFRTLQGAQVFARIRSYLSTMRKQAVDLCQAIKLAMSGNPIIPVDC